MELRIPVHDPDRWNDRRVAETLHEALNFLTGDYWEISFYKRAKTVEPPRQGQLILPEGVSAVLPFSDGLDSRIVAGLMAREMGESLIRVRLGSKTADAKELARQRHPFTSVPYWVRPSARNNFRESSARSRGFKFALLSGLSAYLGKAGQVIVPESGQGALGPAMVTVGQAYEDYRSHPLFTERMERFLAALLAHKIQFRFPRLWYTKAETLKEFVKECEGASKWSATWSCWQQNRQVSVEKKKRQCGICAACMLRRMSAHGAGVSEPNTGYVWENLSAVTFRQGAASSFPRKKITEKLRQYAIAGALHLDHLAALPASPANQGSLELQAFQLSRSLGMPETEVQAKLHRLLVQHGNEWKGFVHSLGRNSFVADWAIYGNA
jgi:7-cyano-7-deazaguanine synthase in queuosine biosynthesis